MIYWLIAPLLTLFFKLAFAIFLIAYCNCFFKGIYIALYERPAITNDINHFMLHLDLTSSRLILTILIPSLSGIASNRSPFDKIISIAFMCFSLSFIFLSIILYHHIYSLSRVFIHCYVNIYALITLHSLPALQDLVRLFFCSL